MGSFFCDDGFIYRDAHIVSIIGFLMLSSPIDYRILIAGVVIVIIIFTPTSNMSGA